QNGSPFMRINGNKFHYMLKRSLNIWFKFYKIFNLKKSKYLINQQEINRIYKLKIIFSNYAWLNIILFDLLALMENLLLNFKVYLKIGQTLNSSETTRETTLLILNNNNFINNNLFLNNQSNKKKKIYKDLEWLIGFTEGDGSFIKSKNRLYFVLTQKEIKILYYIKSLLGFGKVYIYNGIGRYVVTKKEHIDILKKLFFNNLVLNKCKERFKIWNNEQIENNSIESSLLTLNNGWLSGFIDAEGCFNVNITKNDKYITGYRVRLRFMIDQKDESEVLKKIQILLGNGRVSKRSKTTTERLTLDTFISFPKLIDYLEKYPLKTKKRITFFKWRKIYLLCKEKKHLTIKGFNKIKKFKKLKI
nr:orf360 [Zancudomyces culisetae]AAW49506.1 orf360 [Zancudomyces culisetae]